MTETENSKDKGRNDKGRYRPVLGIAVVSLLVCGLFFPILITGLAQLILPYQANGELVKIGGAPVGSNNAAQNFTLPIFFHPRNDSASRIDPDITVQDAYSQTQRISDATGIPVASLQQLIDRNIDRQGRFVELQYVNVLSLNLQLVKDYPSQYGAYTG